MLKDADRITSLEMFILIFSSINAVEVMIVPRTLAEALGTDGWIALFGGHLIAAVVMFFIVKLGLLFPNETMAEYAPKILGRYLGIPLLMIAALSWCLLTARIVRQFADFMELILPQTPIEVIIITILYVVARVARHGIEPIARVLEILFPLFVGILGLLIIIAAFQIDLSNLLPIFQASPKELALESLKTFLGLEGQEILLMLLPFMAVPKNAYKVAYGALASNLVLRLTLFVVTIATFGTDLIKELVWPVEELSRGFPGGMFGRLDSVFIALWVTVAFTSILVFYYLSSLTFSRVMKFREPSMTVLPLLPLIFFLTLVPANVAASEELSGYFSWFWGGYTLTVPILLLVVTHIRGIHLQKNQERERER